MGASPAGPADSQKGGGLTVRARNGASCGKLGCWCGRGHGLEGEEGGCHRRVTKVSLCLGHSEGLGVLTLVTFAALPQRRAAPTRLHARPGCLGEAHGRGGRASKGRLWREVGLLLMYSRGTVECDSQTRGANVLVSAGRYGPFSSPCFERLEGDEVGPAQRWGRTGRRPP